jgi:hypothetical protein
VLKFIIIMTLTISTIITGIIITILLVIIISFMKDGNSDGFDYFLDKPKGVFD